MFEHKLPIEARKTDADGIAIDIGDQQPSGLWTEANQPRRAPPDGSSDVAIVDQAEALKRRQTVGNDRAPETSVALDVEPRRRFAAAHQRQDSREALTLGFDGA